MYRLAHQQNSAARGAKRRSLPPQTLSFRRLCTLRIAAAIFPPGM
jgi:hypothetical protein